MNANSLNTLNALAHCFSKARVFDCRTDNACKSWSCQGEVEKVTWNHFRPYSFLSATDSGKKHFPYLVISDSQMLSMHVLYHLSVILFQDKSPLSINP